MKNKSQFSLESSQQLHCRVGQFSRHPQQFCCQTAPPPFFCSQLKEKRFACHLSGLAFSWEHSVQFQSLNNTVIFLSLFYVFSTSCQLTNQSFALLSLFKCSGQFCCCQCMRCSFKEFQENASVATQRQACFLSVVFPLSVSMHSFPPSLTYFGVFPFVKLLVSTLCPLCQHVLAGAL